MKISIPSASPSKDIGNQAWLRGAISRWVWRIYAQRLTVAGRWFILPSIAMSLYGGASLKLQGYVAFSYFAAVWVLSIATAWVWRPRVKLNVVMGDRVGVGEVLWAEVEVREVGRKSVDLTVMPHRLPGAIDAVEEEGMAVPNLKRGEVARVKVGLRCGKRGAYLLRGFRAESDYPFGLVRSRQVHLEEKRLLVYPKFTPLVELKVPSGRTYQPGGVAMTSVLGESTEYIGNREYREGDPVRDIDWRATARMSRPIVREYREEYLLRAAVVLDTQVVDEEGFECAVSLAAAVSDFMARHDYLVDLFAAGPNLYHLTAGRSLAYLDQILDILACVEGSEGDPFSVIEPELVDDLSRVSTVVCIFLRMDEARRGFLERLAQRGVGVKVVVVSAEDCRAGITSL